LQLKKLVSMFSISVQSFRQRRAAAHVGDFPWDLIDAHFGI
jgi:hypothetical protein